MPFQNQRYTADDFFRINADSDSSERYELINGDIVAHAAPSVIHQRILGKLYRKFGDFIDSNKGSCEPFISPVDVVLDDENVVQPDFFIVCNPDVIDDKRCNGAPDFIVEITSSNYTNDYIDKLALYKNSGVREYWIVDPSYSRVLVYFFEKGNSPSIYTFDMDIPVSIYEGKLSINISEMLG